MLTDYRHFFTNIFSSKFVTRDDGTDPNVTGGQGVFLPPEETGMIPKIRQHYEAAPVRQTFKIISPIILGYSPRLEFDWKKTKKKEQRHCLLVADSICRTLDHNTSAK